MNQHVIQQGITESNRSFYNSLWSNRMIKAPESFNTWPLISALLPAAADRLEIGPGLHPRLPIIGTNFVDISLDAVNQLHMAGGTAELGEINGLPFRDERFDLVCAFDVIEHSRDDRQVFAELSRVLKDDGILIMSVPLHPHLWTEFDGWAGHARRYVPDELVSILADNQLVPEKSAAFGIQPAKQNPLKFCSWCNRQNPQEALFVYNRVMLVSINFQRSLHMVNGLMETTDVKEIVLVCRRGARSPKSCSPGSTA